MRAHVSAVHRRTGLSRTSGPGVSRGRETASAITLADVYGREGERAGSVPCPLIVLQIVPRCSVNRGAVSNFIPLDGRDRRGPTTKLQRVQRAGATPRGGVGPGGDGRAGVGRAADGDRRTRSGAGGPGHLGRSRPSWTSALRRRGWKADRWRVGAILVPGVRP